MIRSAFGVAVVIAFTALGGCAAEAGEELGATSAALSSPRRAGAAVPLGDRPPERDPGPAPAPRSARVGFVDAADREGYSAELDDARRRGASTSDPLRQAATTAVHVARGRALSVRPPTSSGWETTEFEIDEVAKGSLSPPLTITILRRRLPDVTDCSGIPALHSGNVYIASLVPSHTPGQYELADGPGSLVPATAPGTFALPGRDSMRWTDVAALIGGRP